jgi:dipeptidyl aminopeptidase/acylaminoacyl peptidase
MHKTMMLILILALPLAAAEPGSEASRIFQLNDVFGLEWASDPQISPDGSYVVYVRNSMDVMNDRRRSKLWTVSVDANDHRPLTDGSGSEGSPRFSPDGTRLVYSSSSEGSSQLYMRWLDTGQSARLTQLPASPGGLSFSPDGRQIAFSMLVREPASPFAKLPPKPAGAEWAAPAIAIDKLIYRADGAGYLEDGYRQLFVVSAEGGTPRQVSSGPFHHRSAPVWAKDGQALLFSANRHDDWELDPRNSEIYELRLADGKIGALTERHGPDRSPVVSPDGQRIAYLGYDDHYQGYQVWRLYVMNRDGSGRRVVAGDLDRSVSSPAWSADSQGIYFEYSDQGNGKLGYVGLDGGKTKVLAADVGGLSIGRPYSGSEFSVTNDHVVFTLGQVDHPADIAVLFKDAKGVTRSRRLTHLNADLLAHKELAQVEEIWWKSSHDGRDIQGWIAKPPGFEKTRKYPFILEIHGGPFADYGDRFAAEVQLYAAAGYVVLYANPRGSTSYGEEFGNLIHHAYPGYDYDDLMSGVDAVIERGYVDKENLFVTGGSGGGVLTAWIVGKTDRFQAAVSAKPVINWYSFVLTSDSYNTYYRYWFPGFPWDHPEHYMERSPLSLVGNVKTPTMLLTGEMDHRTPISESEQFYQALKLRQVDAMLVRIPGASHGIASRPSQLMTKVAHILAWFEKYRTDVDP